MTYKSQLKKCLKEGNAQTEMGYISKYTIVYCASGKCQCTSFNCKKIK